MGALSVWGNQVNKLTVSVYVSSSNFLFFPPWDKVVISVPIVRRGNPAEKQVRTFLKYMYIIWLDQCELSHEKAITTVKTLIRLLLAGTVWSGSTLFPWSSVNMFCFDLMLYILVNNFFQFFSRQFSGFELILSNKDKGPCSKTTPYWL